MTATLTDADVRLKELVEQAANGVDVVLVHQNKAVARIVPVKQTATEPANTLNVPSYHLGFKGEMPSRSDIADEMLER